MADLSQEQVQTLANILGIPVGPEEVEELTARFNAMLWTMKELDQFGWEEVDPLNWGYPGEEV